jgi:hypothetical protein
MRNSRDLQYSLVSGAIRLYVTRVGLRHGLHTCNAVSIAGVSFCGVLYGSSVDNLNKRRKIHRTQSARAGYCLLDYTVLASVASVCMVLLLFLQWLLVTVSNVMLWSRDYINRVVPRSSTVSSLLRHPCMF